MLFSEPKIPQSRLSPGKRNNRNCFSALQRAENSSIPQTWTRFVWRRRFQCSSASRKFLNCQTPSVSARRVSFSALQRAENSSIPLYPRQTARTRIGFSALQRAENSSIPRRVVISHGSDASFSALQRAENSSICERMQRIRLVVLFQCSSASRKFLNSTRFRLQTAPFAVSVLFSEPKIPQYRIVGVVAGLEQPFQCSSASRKFLNVYAADC